MKTKFYVLIIIFVPIALVAKSEKISSKRMSEAENKNAIFASKLGYELSYPDCLDITAHDAYDLDEPIDTVDILLRSNKKICRGETREVFISIIKQRPLAPNESSDDFANRVEKNAKYSKTVGGTEYILIQKNPFPNFPIVKINRTKDDSLIFETYFVCNSQLFFMKFGKKVTKYKFDVIKAIKSGKPSIPEIEMEIIDSLKCSRN